MTVKELIDKLKECDPNSIVCTGGNDSIKCIEHLPAYYDGRLVNVSQDEYGNPVKIEVGAKGTKVKIHSYDIEDVIFENPRINVIVGNDSRGTLKTYAEWRQEGLDYERHARKKYDSYNYLEKYDDMLFIWDKEEL